MDLKLIKLKKWAIGAIVVSGLVWGVNGALLHSDSVPVREGNLQVAEEQESVDRLEWKTYYSNEHGFEFKYPANWRINKGRDDTGLVLVAPEDKTFPHEKRFAISIVTIPSEGYFLGGSVNYNKLITFDELNGKSIVYEINYAVDEEGFNLHPFQELSRNDITNDFLSQFQMTTEGRPIIVSRLGDGLTSSLYTIPLNSKTLFRLHPSSPTGSYSDTELITILQSVRSNDSVDTASWQTYRSEEYGFEFKYPSLEPLDVYDEWRWGEWDIHIKIPDEGSVHVVKEREEGCFQGVCRDVAEKVITSRTGIEWDYFGEKKYCDADQCSPLRSIYRAKHSNRFHYLAFDQVPNERDILNTFSFFKPITNEKSQDSQSKAVIETIPGESPPLVGDEYLLNNISFTVEAPASNSALDLKRGLDGAQLIYEEEMDWLDDSLTEIQELPREAFDNTISFLSTQNITSLKSRLYGDEEVSDLESVYTFSLSFIPIGPNAEGRNEEYWFIQCNKTLCQNELLTVKKYLESFLKKSMLETNS